jgi:hypothetical protein
MWDRFWTGWVLWVDALWVNASEMVGIVWAPIKEQLYQIFIWIDQGLNVFPLMGSADETMSSRCFRMNHIPAYRRLEILVNALFRPLQGPEHCRNAYIKEVRRRQFPRDFLKKAVEMGIFPEDPTKTGDEMELQK